MSISKILSARFAPHRMSCVAAVAWVLLTGLMAVPSMAKAKRRPIILDEPAIHLGPQSSSNPIFPHWSIEIRTGPLRPRASRNTGARDYYRLIFEQSGRDKSLFENRPLLSQLEGAWYPFYAYGVLGIYGRIGTWKATGAPRICQSTSSAQVGCTQSTVFNSQPGNESTTLQVLPVGLGAVYRFDHLHRRFGVPLVFYAKLGLDYYWWWNRINGELSKRILPDGSEELGRGGTLGASAAAGISLALSWLEPGVAARGQKRGLYESYLFFEVNQLFADGLVAGGQRFDFSDTTFQIGLALAFL